MSTISKVAERAGVSRTTVSHVLNHADRVSPGLRERVQAAIRELGYVPNPQAQSLRTGRTNLVAMLIPDIRNPFYPELVRTVQEELETAGLDTLIFNTDVPGGHPQDHGREYLRQIRNRRLDGVIVGDFALQGVDAALDALGTPAVFIGNMPDGAVDSVRLDDFGGGYRMGAHLADKGHRRVAHVTGPSFFAEAMMRAEGFEKGLAEHGAPPDPGLRFEGTYLAPSGQAAVRWLVERHGHDMPTAIFFGNYLMSIGAMAELHDQGVRVPGDIKVALFGDQEQLGYVRPRPTRVGAPPAELARRAARLLLDRLAGRYDGPPRQEVVACALREFDTA